MRRLFAGAVGALALSWTTGAGHAQDQGPRGQVAARTIAAGQAKGADASPTIQDGMCCSPGGCTWDQYCGYDNGCHGGRGLTVIGGAGLYLIAPAWETNPAYRITNAAGATRQQDFRYDWDGAPEGWFGVVGECGFGARVRYWQYAQSAVEALTGPLNADVVTASPQGVGSGTINPIAGDTLNFRSDLNVLVWDLEFMQSWSPGCWELNGSAGVRYAHVSQNYTAQRIDAAGATPFSLFSGTSFNGAGPTLALEGRRAIGDSGFALYANGRASLLFGSAFQRTFRTSGVRGATISTTAEQQQTDVLPVGELEIGTEFGRDFGRARAMLQVGMVAQCWFGAGNAAQVESTFTNGADGSSNLGFFGMVVRAGLSY